MSKQLNQEIVERRINDLTEYVSRSLHFVEAKNGSFLAFCGAIIVAILSFKTEYCVQKLFLLCSLLPLFICETLLAYSFFPKNKNIKKKKQRRNKSHEKTLPLFSCENISEMDRTELREYLSEGFSDYEFNEFENHKITSIINDACAAAHKYRLFRYALKTLAYFGGIFLGYVFFKVMN